MRDRLRLEAMQRDLNEAVRLSRYGDVTVTFDQAHAVLTRADDRNRSATMVCSTCGRGTRLQKICARKRRRKKKTGEDKRKKRRQEKKGLNPTWSRQLSNCCPRTKGLLWLVFGNQTGCTKLQQEGRQEG